MAHRIPRKQKWLISLLFISSLQIAIAQEEASDSLTSTLLNEIVVEGRTQFLSTGKSTFLPTKIQKNSAQTGIDLLGKMGIPVIRILPGSESVQTVSGDAVAIYIDFVPATQDEIKMLRPADVVRVEYYDHPSDSRFQAAAHVVNFVMKKYDYGAYVKALLNEKFITNSGVLQANARMCRHKMTYDIMAHGNYSSKHQTGGTIDETFRLLKADGSKYIFDRITHIDKRKRETSAYQASFRAKYNGNSFVANTMVTGGLDRSPKNSENGTVSYSDNSHTSSVFTSDKSKNSGFIRLNGFYFLTLSTNSSLTADINGELAKERGKSYYTEAGADNIINGAKDNTQNISVKLTYGHSFDNSGNILIFGRGIYERNNTRYSGTCDDLDKSYTKFGQTGISYNLTKGKIHASAGLGWNWISTRLNTIKNSSNYPHADVSIQYTIDQSKSISLDGHYSVWPPSSNYKSDNIIQISPFLWHTGNPRLTSHRSFDFSLRYVLIPSNRYNLSVSFNSWMVGNRESFVYLPYKDGIIRTLMQPMGFFAKHTAGLYASTRQLDGKLQLSANMSGIFVNDRRPFGLSRSALSYWIQANYYLGNFNFGAAYISKESDIANSMSGVWKEDKDSYFISAGCAINNWNIRLTVNNFCRWKWEDAISTMESTHYCKKEISTGTSKHAMIQLSATYTFEFGKKIDKSNGINLQKSGNSGILN